MAVALDIEVLPNYFLVMFKNEENGKTVLLDTQTSLAETQKRKLRSILSKYTTFGFNSNNYDIPLIDYALSGASVSQIHKASQYIIENGVPFYRFYNEYSVTKSNIDHFDIKEVAPAVMISLKVYGTRIGSRKLQEFFLDPNLEVSKEEIERLKSYCENDLDVTIDLCNSIKDRLKLRQDMSDIYAMDLRSKSDAQIAEAVIVSELYKKYKKRAVKPELKANYKALYNVPEFVKFESKELQEVLSDVKQTIFTLDKGGSVKLPSELANRKITIGNTIYKMGIGGLHSQEKQLVVESNDEFVMRNADFTSYYPFIILNLGLYPKQLGKEFLLLYREIVETRLKAKTEGNSLIAQSYKIILNGSFGKFGSKYSALYSPDLLLATTLTGQLTLLMLIERLEAKGIEVVSANTDGLEYYCKRSDVALAEAIIFDLEMETGFQMEHGQYKALYARDVNNYVAVYDGYVKAKGVYSETSLMKGRQTPIVFKAVRDYLGKGVSISKTVCNCTDMNEFVSARTVKGGAIYYYGTLPNTEEYINHIAKNGEVSVKAVETRNAEYQKQFVIGSDESEYLGKVVRWYYSTEGNAIYYKTGNKVPKTDGAKPMMDLVDDIPDDLDYNWYIQEAIEMLKDLGVDYVE